jgi:hypothetical protein
MIAGDPSVLYLIPVSSCAFKRARNNSRHRNRDEWVSTSEMLTVRAGSVTPWLSSFAGERKTKVRVSSRLSHEPDACTWRN